MESVDYSKRSHLSRIKERVNKVMMPLSRSCPAKSFSMSDPRVPTVNAIAEAQAAMSDKSS